MKSYVKDHKEEGNFLWLTMEADADVLKKLYFEHFTKVVSSFSMPGFRKGHAPMDRVIRDLKNKGSFGRELEIVVGQAIEKTVVKMSEEEKTWDEKIFGLPVENKVSEFDLDKWYLKFESKFEKFPIVTLADYSKIETLIEEKKPNLDICPCTEAKEAEKNDVVAVAMLGKKSTGEPVNKYVYDMLEIDLENTKIRKEIVDSIIGKKARDKVEVKLKDGSDEITLEIWVIEVRKKEPVNQKLVERLKLPGIDSVEKMKEAIEKWYKTHNSYVRYQDILKWLYSQDNKVDPFPVEGIRREAARAYNGLLKRGRKDVSFENVFYEHSKNLKTTLVLDAISKKENIKIDEKKDREEFAKNIEENPWIYGNRRVEDVFNCSEDVLKEYIVQFKTIQMLIEKWHFSK